DANHSPEEKARRYIARYDARCEMLSKHLRDMGFHADPDIWKKKNSCYLWMERVRDAIHDIKSLVQPGDTLILVDADEWGIGRNLAGLHVLPFMERNGQYWGPPGDDATAIAELERLRQCGARFIVFAWPAFWWL